MWKFLLSNKNGKVAEVNEDPGEDTGLVVATRNHKTYTTKTVFATNPTYGREMAQNAAYSSVLWMLHDGGDTSSADSGTADTNTLNHVIEAAQNFLTTVAVGMTVTSTNDANVTVVADTDLTCDGDPCPNGNEAYTVAPAWTFSEPTGTKWVENSTAQYHAGAASLLCDNANVNDTMQLINVNGVDIDLTNFAAFTMWVYVDKDWQGGDSVSIYAHVGGVQAGNKVYLEDYFNFDNYDTWQYINIPLADMGLATTTIDAIRFENEAREGGKSPKFYLDEITLQVSGAAID